MKAGVVVYPGSNCDRDVADALRMSGADVQMLWHAEAELPKLDLVVVPGGFSYGDYLRSGAIAAHSPLMREVKKHAEAGGYVLGICNGFQVLTETRLLPGVLMRNRDLNFICRDVNLLVNNDESIFTEGYKHKKNITIPIAHHDGNYVVSDDELAKLEQNDQIAFRYVDKKGAANDNANPNGSVGNIAGVLNAQKNVLGMMPHPERLCEDALGGTDGKLLFDALVNKLS